jgi:hypothetical protein
MNKRHITLAIALSLALLSTGIVGAADPTGAAADNPNPPDGTVKLIFIHHSCGENWLADENGGLGIALRNNHYFISDTNYGWGPDSIGDNTDIGHWWTWFRGPQSATYLSALYAESGQHAAYSRLPDDPGGENQIIMSKSCYPNSELQGSPSAPVPPIGSNPLRGQESGSEHHTISNAKGIYNDLLPYFASRQDKLFVVITAPPVQSDAWANNARALNTWLVEEWLTGYPHNNVAVFDFYNVLTSNGGNWHTNDLDWATGNHHRWHVDQQAIEYIHDQGDNTAAYPDGGSDDHPSPAGNQKATGEFASLLNVFYHRWRGTPATPALRLLVPNGGEQWPVGSQQQIRWNTTGSVPQVGLAVSTDNFATAHIIAPSVANTGSYTWQVPDMPSTSARVRVASVVSPTTVYDVSDAAFTIYDATGQQTMIFQDGVGPDASYAGTADVILAQDANANANLGGLENLETFFGEGEEHRRSLLRWDLSALPAGSTVNAASLELYRYGGGAESPAHLVLYRLAREWAEGTGHDFWPEAGYVPDGATWSTFDGSTPWSTPGGDYDGSLVGQVTLPASVDNGWIRLDATAAVQAWVTAEMSNNHGLLLRPHSGDSTYHYYYSRSHPVPALRPRLVVTYTVGGPVPPKRWIYLPVILKSLPLPNPGTGEPPEPPSQRIQPADLVYRGAFRLPDGPEEIGWAWSGEAMTYYPGGDPSGPADGYPGSLFGTGHNWNQWVSEISIPVPVDAPAQDLADLNTATTLQEFQNIRGDLFDHLDFEIPRAGLEYLPRQGAQMTDKLHFCWGQHMQEGGQVVSHGWCELDLSNPQPAGAWYMGNYSNYATNDYLFAIPDAWAETYTPGMRLASGRFRDGGWSGQGPSLLAYGPWQAGNPPPAGTRLQAIPLLLYDASDPPGSHTMVDYQHSDEWSGGAWLTAGDKSAVIFVGTKGQGDCWYGDPDGPCEDCEDRGWWSDRFVGQILFYDPAHLEAVAQGEMATWEPQPYATLEVDEWLYHIESNQQKHHLGAASFDRERGLLYVFEPLVDEDKPLVHVWRVE